MSRERSCSSNRRCSSCRCRCRGGHVKAAFEVRILLFPPRSALLLFSHLSHLLESATSTPPALFVVSSPHSPRQKFHTYNPSPAAQIIRGTGARAGESYLLQQRNPATHPQRGELLHAIVNSRSTWALYHHKIEFPPTIPQHRASRVHPDPTILRQTPNLMLKQARMCGAVADRAAVVQPTCRVPNPTASRVETASDVFRMFEQR